MPPRVALETTLLVHGVPRHAALGLYDELCAAVRSHGAEPRCVGVVRGTATSSLTREQLAEMLDAGHVGKLNLSNLPVALHRGLSGATTVSATMHIAAGHGVRVFATGGIGGVHRGSPAAGGRLDISADLVALARYPVAVVASGAKSILDVESTREVLETLGVPVVGFCTDRFPAFYQRGSDAGVDAVFDDEKDLARFLEGALAASPARGVLVCNPVPAELEIGERDWRAWLAECERLERDAGASPPGGDGGGAGAGGGTPDSRGVTPRMLGRLHEVSGGATLRTNIGLVRSNTELAARLARRMG